MKKIILTSYIKVINYLMICFCITVWYMNIFYWFLYFSIFVFFLNRKTFKLHFHDNLMFLWNNINHFLYLMRNCFLQFSKVHLIRCKESSYLFAIIFSLNGQKLINWVVSFKISVLIKKNILMWHFFLLCYIFI